MITAPVNEAGVMVLFGAMATRLGFAILHLQAGVPDCEALRLCRDERWRLVLIAFEFESRNFVMHGHNQDGCELIVCWKHTWRVIRWRWWSSSRMVGLPRINADERG